MEIGLLTVGTIFVQVVLLSMGSYLCCFEGEYLLLFNVMWELGYYVWCTFGKATYFLLDCNYLFVKFYDGR